MFFDWDGEAGREEVGERERETRCYTLTGEARVLDQMEALLRRIEWLGEQEAGRLVCVYVEGTRAAVMARSLASWEAETEGGAPLPRLEDEGGLAVCYAVEIG